MGCVVGVCFFHIPHSEHTVRHHRFQHSDWIHNASADRRRGSKNLTSPLACMSSTYLLVPTGVDEEQPFLPSLASTPLPERHLPHGRASMRLAPGRCCRRFQGWSSVYRVWEGRSASCSCIRSSRRACVCFVSPETESFPSLQQARAAVDP